MAILLTGGAGYIGSHTAVQLLNNGLTVVSLDDYSNAKPDVLARVAAITGREVCDVHGSLLDPQAIDDVFAAHDIDTVIHFAGFKAVGESVEQPLAYYQNNLTGTLNLLQAMTKHGVKRFVFSSSATVYAGDNPVPYREGMATGATNPYGWTKVMIEQMLGDLVAADPQWSVVMLRYFNPIGAHPSGLIGEDPAGIPNNLVPYIAKVAAGELPFVRVWGNDYATPDGTGVRDYIHVVDLADGHLAALNYLDGNPNGGIWTFNLGTGVGYSVLDVVAAYAQACGKELPVQIMERRAGDLASVYADPSKAVAELGFHTTRGLAEMCADSWRWQQHNQ